MSRVHGLGWIDSKQLDSSGNLKPCNAPQCGGFTLEAEFGIPKNSDAEPDFLGWELKQYAVEDFEKIESSKPITLMTPEPTGGFYKDESPEAFVRKFGYADKSGKVDRMNFGGRHFVGRRCPPTGLTMQLKGFDAATGKTGGVLVFGVAAALGDERKPVLLQHADDLFGTEAFRHERVPA
ncbi:MAG: MvaI/BcnI family restriction endonuclease, partial [Verrucomicrobiota bacterium]